MDVAAVRDSLKATIAGITGLRVHDTIPDLVAPPAAVIVPDTCQFDYDTSGGVTLTFRVDVFAATQDKLDAYLGTGSGTLAGIIAASPRLGSNLADWSRVVRWDTYGRTDVAGSPMWGVSFFVDVTL